MGELSVRELPIFPLPEVVLFPQEVLPLHIFESRYRIMLKSVLESDSMFGVIKFDPKTKSITKNTSSRKSDRVEDDNTDHDGGKHQIEDNEFMTEDEKLSFFACLLFSLVTQTTVGFAWFVPTDNKTRIIVFFQLITVLCITTYTLI